MLASFRPGKAQACYLLPVGRLYEWRKIGIWPPVISGSWRWVVGVLDARHRCIKIWDYIYIYMYTHISHTRAYAWYEQCTYIDSFIQCRSAEEGKGWQYVLEPWVHSRNEHLYASLLHSLQLFPVPCLNLQRRVRFNITHLPLTRLFVCTELGIRHHIRSPRSHNQISSTVLDGPIGNHISFRMRR
jgi:hypothetical protein